MIIIILLVYNELLVIIEHNTAIVWHCHKERKSQNQKAKQNKTNKKEETLRSISLVGKSSYGNKY